VSERREVEAKRERRWRSLQVIALSLSGALLEPSIIQAQTENNSILVCFQKLEKEGRLIEHGLHAIVKNSNAFYFKTGAGEEPFYDIKKGDVVVIRGSVCNRDNIPFYYYSNIPPKYSRSTINSPDLLLSSLAINFREATSKEIEHVIPSEIRDRPSRLIDQDGEGRQADLGGSQKDVAADEKMLLASGTTGRNQRAQDAQFDQVTPSQLGTKTTTKAANLEKPPSLKETGGTRTTPAVEEPKADAVPPSPVADPIQSQSIRSSAERRKKGTGVPGKDTRSTITQRSGVGLMVSIIGNVVLFLVLVVGAIIYYIRGEQLADKIDSLHSETENLRKGLNRSKAENNRLERNSYRPETVGAGRSDYGHDTETQFKFVDDVDAPPTQSASARPTRSVNGGLTETPERRPRTNPPPDPRSKSQPDPAVGIAQLLSEYQEAIRSVEASRAFIKKWHVLGTSRDPSMSIKNAVALERGGDPEQTDFWCVPTTHTGMYLVLPGWNTVTRASSLIADSGRPAERLFKGIFEIHGGSTNLDVQNHAVCKLNDGTHHIIELGSLRLPIRSG
jgi:hypothetical protein